MNSYDWASRSSNSKPVRILLWLLHDMGNHATKGVVLAQTSQTTWMLSAGSADTRGTFK